MMPWPLCGKAVSPTASEKLSEKLAALDWSVCDTANITTKNAKSSVMKSA